MNPDQSRSMLGAWLKLLARSTTKLTLITFAAGFIKLLRDATAVGNVTLSTTIIFIVGAAICVAGTAVYIIFCYKVACELRRSDYQLCIHCRYCMSGIEVSRCPECGHHYHAEQARSAWLRHMISVLRAK